MLLLQKWTYDPMLDFCWNCWKRKVLASETSEPWGCRLGATRSPLSGTNAKSEAARGRAGERQLLWDGGAPTPGCTMCSEFTPHVKSNSSNSNPHLAGLHASQCHPALPQFILTILPVSSLPPPVLWPYCRHDDLWKKQLDVYTHITLVSQPRMSEDTQQRQHPQPPDLGS